MPYKIRKISATVGLFLILSFVVVVVPEVKLVEAEPKTIVVPDDYGSIQEAIDDAYEGDTIYVKEGTYHENLVINKSLSLIGEDVDTTVIDGNPPEGYRVPITIYCDGVSVSGFKLLYGYAGIQMVSVKNCSISGNRIAGSQHGIRLVSTSYSNITENYFEQIGLSSAIHLSYSTNNLVTGNYIKACTEGIQILLDSCNNTVTGNTITKCDDVAIRFKYSDYNLITENDVSKSGVGTSIYVSNNNTITNNNYVNNTVQFSANEWYALTFGHNVSVNNINENYWSDYNGTDTNGDGIGNTPYIIDENNQDNNPILNPIEIEAIPEFPSWIILPWLLTVALVVTLYRKRLVKPPIHQSY